jgi:MoaA/NifB/PqqE/SkfB family radical SAM enzyme
MDWNNRVYQLEVDITSNCNAQCGACARNNYGGETIDGLPLENFDVSVWNRLVNTDLANKNIVTLELRGIWGDPCNHPNLPEMLELFCEKNPSAVIFMTTSGSFQSTHYWETLARVLKEKSYFHRVDFNIDGLADTNHIFRRNTDYNKILENVKAFNLAGGNSGWRFQVFNHNKHQVMQAKELAEQIGCMEFSSKRTPGSEPILIETATETYNIAFDDIDDVEYDTWQFLDDTEMIEVFEKLMGLEITSPCPWFAQGKIHIDPWGFVWPCSHISSFTYNDDPKGIIIDDMFDEHGMFNNLKENTLAAILSHEWFSETHDRAVTNGKWEVCREECGACGAV